MYYHEVSQQFICQSAAEQNLLDGRHFDRLDPLLMDRIAALGCATVDIEAVSGVAEYDTYNRLYENYRTHFVACYSEAMVPVLALVATMILFGDSVQWPSVN